MPYEVVTTGVQAAIEAVLEADTGLAALLASKPTTRGGGPGIYTDGDVPQGATFPYLTVGAWTQIPFHSLSPGTNGYGWNCTVQIKAVGQRSQSQLAAVLSEVFGLLPHGSQLDVDGYTGVWCDEMSIQPAIKTTQAGVTTYELPAILRVYVTP